MRPKCRTTSHYMQFFGMKCTGPNYDREQHRMWAQRTFPRMKELGWKTFCLDSNAEGYYYLPTSEVVKTTCKYGVKFIITEKPKIFALPKIYENEQFILYRAPQCSGTGSS